MLEDRDYMREPDFRGRSFGGIRWSWTVALIISYVVVLLAEVIGGHFFPFKPWYAYCALSKEGLEHGYVWQLVTYQFMHAGWLHLFFNSWVIFVFGRELESVLGGKKFLALMFSSGVVGGVVQILMALMVPKLFGGMVVGASAAGFGLVAAYAAMFPHREMTMLVFLVIPVTLNVMRLLLIFAAGAVVGLFFPSHIANAAHLGGMAMGWFYIRNILQGNWRQWEGIAESQEDGWSKKAPRRAAVQEVSEPSVAEQVDPILEKISAHGIQSLTSRERDILESARKKMDRK